jgi:hypothetical protein
MISKTKDSEISLLLDIIMQETRKHRELLKHLSKFFESNPVVSATECEKQMGQFFVQALALVHSVRDEVTRGIPIAKAASRLVAFEESANEEYVTEMNTRVAMLVETNQAVKKVLEDIAEDERGHVEILQLVAETASK